MQELVTIKPHQGHSTLIYKIHMVCASTEQPSKLNKMYFADAIESKIRDNILNVSKQLMNMV